MVSEAHSEIGQPSKLHIQMKYAKQPLAIKLVIQLRRPTSEQIYWTSVAN